VEEEKAQMGNLPVIQPPEEMFHARGQIIAFLHMMDEAITDCVAVNDGTMDAFEEGHNLLQVEFFCFLAGMVMGSAKYLDALLPLASEGPELTASGLIVFDPKQPPEQEEELFWPEALQLPKALAGGEFKLGSVLKRDHDRDRAIVKSICTGESTRQANVPRLVALAEMLVAGSLMVNERAAYYMLFGAAQCLWTAGDVEGGLEILDSLAVTYPDKYAAGVAEYYREKLPNGPSWIQAKKWREEAV